MIPHKWISAILFCALLGVASFRIHNRFFSKNAVLVFFDVGQGDAALLKLPNGETYMVDSGGGWGEARIGSELVSELARLGILKLNGIILSHLDSDHAQGALTLLRNLKIHQIWFSKYLADDQENRSWLWGQIKAETKNQKTQLAFIDKPMSIQTETYRLHFYPIQKARLKSNDGLAIQLEVHGCRFLLMGDLDSHAEKKLKPLFSVRPIVLKVAHHGSRSSSHLEWLQQIKPKTAVISVGASNRYGHPHPSVLNRLAFVGARVLRTDLHGAITFTVRPDGLVTCQSALGFPCGEYLCH